MARTFVILHNVSSSSKCIDFVRVALALGFQNIIITKASGSAATGGVPSAQKFVAQKGGNLFYLQSLDDVKDLFGLSELFIIAPPGYGKETLTDELAKEIASANTGIVIGGSDPGLSRKELESGRAIQLDLKTDPGTIGTTALVLDKVSKYQ